MITKLEQAARQALEALDAMLTHMGMDEDEWTKPTFDQARVAITALREALDHIAGVGKVIPRFIPVGIVNDHHSIDWMEEIVDDQAPIGAILYALQDSIGRNVSFAEELPCLQ